MPATTKALRDVELVTVGKHAGSVVDTDGRSRPAVTEVTRADLEAMLAAAQDLAADAAPVKLGHTSSLNAALGDGEPAYGWVRPTRIGTNAAGLVTLYGDLVGMPAKLAEVAPAAFRRRSVEIAWDAVIGGTKRRAVLSAVALLGVAAPAVKGLADVLALYTAPHLEEDHTTTVELGVPEALLSALSAARELGIPEAAIAPLEAEVAARDTTTVPTPTDDDAETPPQTSQTPTPEAPMPGKTYDENALRQLLGLEADADVDTALEQLKSAPAGDTPAPPAAAAPPAPAPAGDTPAAPAAPAAEPDLVTLSAGTHAELTELATWARAKRRDEVLDAAQRDGRITPAERAHFAKALEENEAVTTTLLSGLTPRFATTELGSAGASTEPADEQWTEFETSLGFRP